MQGLRFALNAARLRSRAKCEAQDGALGANCPSHYQATHNSSYGFAIDTVAEAAQVSLKLSVTQG
jgi:hypothetical protein